jgi:hypothetical protein
LQLLGDFFQFAGFGFREWECVIGFHKDLRCFKSSMGYEGDLRCSSIKYGNNEI